MKDGVFDQRRYLIPFRSNLLPQIFTDTLVIGGGVAGMRAAIAAAKYGDVILLAKGDLKNTNTSWAQGGIAVVTEQGDTFESHIADTLEAGAGLCEFDVVKRVVEQAPRLMNEVVEWGMQLDHDASGKLLVGREGGHNASRILHSGGDATGRELQRCLTAKLKATAGIRLFENCFSLDLITPSNQDGSPVMGAITHHPKFGLQMIWAKSTILATGGCGMLFRETTNPTQATADGLAMAYRVGATLADMSFLQFHPTTLYLAGASRSLISEAVRGQGAHLLDYAGNRFMLDVHPLAELAPRDIVSRAIVNQISKQGGQHVWLDCRPIGGFSAKFPEIAALLKRFELDPSKDLIPVHPAAHYCVGGVRTDLDGRTDVPGLFAAGEVACTGLHGANRLASNSLLEGLVFGEAAGCAAGEANTARAGMNGSRPTHASIISDIRPSDRGELDLADVRQSLRSAMWKNVGIERSGARLAGVVEMIDFWARYTLDKIFDDPQGWETQNLLFAGAVVARSAMWRCETRGCHDRSDHPNRESRFEVHDCWRRGMSTPETVALGALAGAK